MKKLTGIGRENEKYFAPFLMGIGDGPGILRIGLISDNEAVGAMAASVIDERADIIQFYIRDDARRKGNGRLLLSSFLDTMHDGGILGISAFYPKDAVLDSFFLSMGFLVLPGDELCVLNVEEILGMKRIMKLRELQFKEEIRSLSELTGAQRASLLELLGSTGISEEDFFAISPDPVLSAVVVRERKAEGALLVKKEGELCLIELLVSEKEAGDLNPQKLLSRLTGFILRDPGISALGFHAYDEHVLRYAERLVGDPSMVKREAKTGMASLVLEEMGEQ